MVIPLYSPHLVLGVLKFYGAQLDPELQGQPCVSEYVRQAPNTPGSSRQNWLIFLHLTVLPAKLNCAIRAALPPLEAP